MILGHIAKRGNRYLRMLFIQGARAIQLHPASWAKHSFGRWLTAAARRLHSRLCNTIPMFTASCPAVDPRSTVHAPLPCSTRITIRWLSSNATTAARRASLITPVAIAIVRSGSRSSGLGVLLIVLVAT
jgi:hypothetical protein